MTTWVAASVGFPNAGKSTLLWSPTPSVARTRFGARAAPVHASDRAESSFPPHGWWEPAASERISRPRLSATAGKRHGPRSDVSKAPRCGAKTRGGTACQCPAMRNLRRCRLHGGKSTGPRTAAGLERRRRARWRYGVYSRETRAILAESRRRWRELRALLGAV